MIAPITNEEKRLLVIYFALSTEIQKRVTYLGRDALINAWDPAQEIACRTLWQAISDTLAVSGTFGPVSADVILARMSQMPEAQVMQQAAGSPMVMDITMMLDSIRLYDVNRAVGHVPAVMQVLQRFVEYRLAVEPSAKVVYETLADNVKDLRDRLSHLGHSAIEPNDFMSPGSPLPQLLITRVPFGIKWLDKMLGGGMEEDAVMLFLAPSGGGKTILGTQMTRARAELQQHACYLSYEQTILGDVQTRFVAMATGVDRKKFESVPPEQWSPEFVSAWNKAQDEYGKFVHPFDFSTGMAGSHGVADVQAAVESEKAKGRKPSLVVIDWVQSAALKWMAAPIDPKLDLRRAKRLNEDLRSTMNNFAMQFAQLCREEKMQGVLLQQLETVSSDVKNKKAHWSQSAECKSLAYWCRVATGISAVNKENGTCMFSTSKATTSNLSGGVGDGIILVNGGVNELFSGSDDYDVDDKTGKICEKVK